MRRRAFTLVELLVVVAIITVLMAMLLPSLKNARSLAKRTICGTNLKGITSATLLYAAEWSDNIPQQFNTVVSSYMAQITLVKANFIPGAADPFGIYRPKIMRCPDGLGITDPWDLSTMVTTNINFKNNYTGPIMTQMGADPRQIGQNAAGLQIFTEYTTNGRHPAWGSGYPFSHDMDSPPFRRVAAMSSVGNTWLIGDGTYPDLGLGYAVFRHTGITINMGYFDGHVEVLRGQDVSGVNFPLWPVSLIVDSRQQYLQ